MHSRISAVPALQFFERILTVVGSLRLQGRNVLVYLEEAIRAAQVGGEAPLLVPERAG